MKNAPDATEQIIQNPSFFANYVVSDNARIFSIDPAGTADFDDAFAIIQNTPFLATVRIYISNVFVWLETLKLWDYVGNRASTIYLPDFKRPMLPSVLSEHSCSLVADKQFHVAFCMEIQINVEKSAIIPSSVKFYNQSIQIDKNYVYESAELFKDPDYCLLRRFTRLLDSNVQDSRDVVAFWMIQMNAICADKLYQRGTGIFRQTVWNTDETRSSSYAEGTLGAHACKMESTMQKHIPDRLHPTTKRIISTWKHASGKYMDFNSVELSPEKELYVHITSPIRRIVDLLNQIIFQVEFGMISSISREAALFVEKWTRFLPIINMKMRSIRKTQIDCDMLQRCSAHPEWMQQLHQGIIFDRVFKPNGMYSYMVHLPELNILGRISSPEKFVNYQSLRFNIYVFEDADKLHRKIRLGIENDMN
jgi:exoribonuclease R